MESHSVGMWDLSKAALWAAWSGYHWAERWADDWVVWWAERSVQRSADALDCSKAGLWAVCSAGDWVVWWADDWADRSAVYSAGWWAAQRAV